MHGYWFTLTKFDYTYPNIDIGYCLEDLLGDISPDASEEEIASRLAAAGIDPDTAKKMVGAVKGGGSKLSVLGDKYFHLHVRIIVLPVITIWTWRYFNASAASAYITS